MRTKLITAFAASALIALASASTARASVTIGDTFAPTDPCAVNVTFLQTSSPGALYASPYAGTITSFSFHAPAAGTDLFKFKVGRPAGGDDFTIVGESALKDPSAGVVNTYASQIPVQRGDVIGLYWNAANTGDCSVFAPDGFAIHLIVGDRLGRDTYEPQDDYKFPISATLDPTNSFSIAGIQRNKKKGTATITATVPNPGDLTASGKGVNAAGAAVTSKAVTPGTATLTIRAKAKKKRKLNDTGKVKLNLAITFTPTGGDRSTQSSKVKLKKKL